MPYICLARSDIPSGLIQALDLAPNSSQRVPALMPPGETRYVNRVGTTVGSVTPTGTLGTVRLDGLAAYLIDNVEPGGLQQASGTITILAGLAAGDIITIAGVDFTAVAGVPVPANQEFQDVAGSGSAAATATSLRATIVHAASIAAMEANVANGKPLGSYVSAAVPVGAAITLTARSSVGGDHALVGWGGSTLTLAISDPAHGTLSGDRLTRASESWTTPIQSAAMTALTDRVDAGLALNLAGINTALLAGAGSELTAAGGSSSRGTVAGILDCMSGRTYRIARTTLATGVVNQYMDATYPAFKMNLGAAHGGFTEQVYVNGDTMQNGEIKPGTIGGTLAAREVGGVRHSFNTDAVAASLLAGQLKGLTSPADLWPNSEVVPRFPWDYAGFLTYPTTTAARLVTVYDDDGSVLT